MTYYDGPKRLGYNAAINSIRYINTGACETLDNTNESSLVPE